VPDADPDAAVAAAMHDVLVHVLPFAVALLDSEYNAAVAAYPSPIRRRWEWRRVAALRRC
jgi:hypothetical protein